MKTAVVVTLIIIGLLTFGLYKGRQIQDGVVSQQQDIFDATIIGNAIAELSVIKMRMVEYYADTGRYAKNNAELGIDPPAAFANEHIQSLSVSSRGELIITLVDKSDAARTARTVRLVGDESLLENSGVFRWKCKTENVSASTLQYIPHCTNYIADTGSESEIALGAPGPIEQEKVNNEQDHSNKSEKHFSLEAYTQNSQSAKDLGNTSRPVNHKLSYELVKAIESGDEASIERLLETKEVLDNRPLFAAVKANHFALVNQFISSGFSVNELDLNGYSLLMEAVLNENPYTSDDLKIIRLLLNRGADVNHVSKQNRTALMSIHLPILPKDAESEFELSTESWKSYNTDENITKAIANLLLDKGASVVVSDNAGYTPLAQAVWVGSKKLAKLYLDHGAVADGYGPNSRYLLDRAIRREYGAIALQLLEHGASIDKTTRSKSRVELLILAIQQNSLTTVNQLLGDDIEADRDLRINGRINSAMNAALVNKRWEIAWVLLQSGIQLPQFTRLFDPASRDRWPEAVYKKYTKVPTIQYLVEVAGKKDVKQFLPYLSDPKHYALHYVLSNGHKYLINPLLDAGADPDARDRNNQSLLEVSILNDDEKSALAFWKVQAIPESESKMQALWQLAYEQDHKELVAVLSEKMQELYPPPVEKIATEEIETQTSDESISVWQINCEAESDGWFAIKSKDNKEQLLLVGGTKAIPYPGFWTPVDVYYDIRFNWISQFELQLKNFDKDAGWDGHRTFYNCAKKQHSSPLVTDWYLEGKKSLTVNLYKDGSGYMADNNIVTGEIVSSQPAFFGHRLTVRDCKNEALVSFMFRVNNRTQKLYAYNVSIPGPPMTFLPQGKNSQEADRLDSEQPRYCP